jgi:osmotically-inducible protein OsmY
MQTQIPWADELSDDDLKQLAAHQLERDLRVAKDEIKLAASEGWITLTGEMETQRQRALAERIVRGVPGVRGVINSIVVRGVARRSGIRKSAQLFSAPQRLYLVQRMAR